MHGAIVGSHFLREDAADAELPRRLEGQDDAAGRRTSNEVDQQVAVPAAPVVREEAAQLARRGRILQDLELLHVGVAVAPALEQEMTLTERTGAAEQRLGPKRDGVPEGGVERRSNGGHVSNLRGEPCLPASPHRRNGMQPIPSRPIPRARVTGRSRRLVTWTA